MKILNMIRFIKYTQCLDKTNFLQFAKKLQEANSSNFNNSNNSNNLNNLKENNSINLSSPLCSSFDNKKCQVSQEIVCNPAVKECKNDIDKNIQILRPNNLNHNIIKEDYIQTKPIANMCQYKPNVNTNCIVNRPISFEDLTTNDLCKYILYYDNHPFKSDSDKTLYNRVVSDYLDKTIKCKNQNNAVETIKSDNLITLDKNIVIKDTPVQTIKCKEPSISTVVTLTCAPKTVNNSISNSCNNSNCVTIIENGKTTVLNNNNIKTITSTETETQTKTQTDINHIVHTQTQIVNHVSTVDKVVTCSKTVESIKPVMVENNKISEETLRNITILVKELLSVDKKENSDNCVSQINGSVCLTSEKKEECKTTPNNNSNNNSNSNSSNKFKSLIIDLLKGTDKKNNLLGWDKLKEKLHMHIKDNKNNVKQCSTTAKETKPENNSETKDTIKEESIAQVKTITTTVAPTNISSEIINEFRKENNALKELEKKEKEKYQKEQNEKVKELEQREKEIAKKEKELDKKLQEKKEEALNKKAEEKKQNEEKKKNIKSDEIVPEKAQKENKQENNQSYQSNVTTNDLIDQLLIFINKSDRNEEDILQLINLIAIVKNDNKGGVRYTKLIPTITVTVENKTAEKEKKDEKNSTKSEQKVKTVTVEGNKDKSKEEKESKKEDNSKNNNKEEKDKNTQNGKDQNIFISKLDKPEQIQPKTIDNSSADKSMLDKIKDMLNFNKTKPYYDDNEIEKLKMEIEEKDKEIEELMKLQKQKKIERMESEQQKEMKKKLEELTKKRNKIMEEINKTETNVKTFDEKENQIKNVKTIDEKGSQIKNTDKDYTFDQNIHYYDPYNPKVAMPAVTTKKSSNKNKKTIDYDNEDSRITVTATKTVHVANKKKKKISEEDRKNIEKEVERVLNSKDTDLITSNLTQTTTDDLNKKKKKTTVEKEEPKIQTEKQTVDSEEIETTKNFTCTDPTDKSCEKKVNFKSAEILLKDTKTNKNIKINIPMKEINDAILEANAKKEEEH